MPATYCPGKPPQAKQITLTEPEYWLTEVGRVTTGDECSNQDFEYFYYKKGVGEVFAGAYYADSDYTDCEEVVHYIGALKFKMTLAPLPTGAVVQKAMLRFQPIYKHYNNETTAFYGPESCVSSVGKASKSWTALADADRWVGQFGLWGYGSPGVSVPDYGPIAVNVTSIVSGWIAKPGTHHGFIIYGDGPPSGNYAYCVSGLSNFQLDIHNLTP